MAGNGVTIGELGAAIGRSISDAQSDLTAGLAQAPRAMAIADATLELKVAASTLGDGAVRLHTVEPEQVRMGQIEPAALSTITFRFAALASEKPELSAGSAGQAGSTPAPQAITERLVEKLRERDYVRRVEGILHDVNFTSFPAGDGLQRVELSAADGIRINYFLNDED